jgi:hypothetical protein
MERDSMPTASTKHTTTASPIIAIPLAADSSLMVLSMAFRIADAAGDQCFADAERAHGPEARGLLHALACQHAHRAEDLAEQICAARADGLTGAAIQSNALAYIDGACWTEERHNRSRVIADASIRRVLAMSVAPFHSDL